MLHIHGHDMSNADMEKPMQLFYFDITSVKYYFTNICNVFVLILKK